MLALVFSFPSHSQSLHFGVGKEYTWLSEFRDYQPVTGSIGYNFQHLELSVEYSNFEWVRRKYRIQECGLGVRYYFNEYKRTLNFFLESKMLTQVYSNGKNAPVLNHLPINEPDVNGSNHYFNRVEYAQKLSFGVNVYHKRLMIYGVVGNAFEIRSEYHPLPNKPKVYSNYSGYGLTVGFGFRYYVSGKTEVEIEQ